jgi:HK97 family phage major capsid protein
MNELLKMLQDQADAFDAFKASQERRLDDMEKRFNRPKGLGGAALGGAERGAEAEYAKAFDRFLRHDVKDGLADLAIKAEMSVGSDPDGGYAVPDELDTEIEKYERDGTPMRQLATVKKLSNEHYEKLVRQGAADAGWVGETEARPETGAPTFASLIPYFGEVYANPGVTQKLLDDSGFDIAEFLSESVGDSFSEYENGAFTTGDGIKKPKGILSYPIVAAPTFGQVKQIKSGSAGAVVADKLIEVSLSLKPKYLKNAAWMMSQATLLAVRTLKNPTTGDYLWRAGLERGDPSTLLGYPIVLNEEMPDPAADSHSIAFGDWRRAYMIGDVRGTRLLRDPYTVKGKVLFYTWKRTSGMVKDFTAYVVHTLSA